MQECGEQVGVLGKLRGARADGRTVRNSLGAIGRGTAGVVRLTLLRIRQAVSIRLPPAPPESGQAHKCRHSHRRKREAHPESFALPLYIVLLFRRGTVLSALVLRAQRIKRM